MIYPNQAVRIVIATKPVDFRKGHDGLAALAERELGLDPHSGIIVVFRAKRGDRIKVLLDLSQFCSGPLLCCYAAFRSKASGLFQPNAEWRRRGL